MTTGIEGFRTHPARMKMVLSSSPLALDQRTHKHLCYRTNCPNDGEEATREHLIKTVIEGFHAKGDIDRIVNIWKSLVVGDGTIENADEQQAWSSIESLYFAGELSSSTIIVLCKFKVRKQPRSLKALGVLADYSRSLMDINARIALWKSVISVQYNINSEWAVNELELAILEKGDAEYANSFWKLMVRNYPKSWRIAQALNTVFDEQGIDEMAIAFWKKAATIHPAEPHFAHFLAESAKHAGEFKTAIQVCSEWLDRFLSDENTATRIEFNKNTIIDSLDDAIRFEYEPTDVIKFWSASLERYPAPSPDDLRRNKLAAVVLKQCNERPHGRHKTPNIRGEPTRRSPTNDQISPSTVPVRSSDSSTIQSNGFQGREVYVRLAQLCFARHDLGRVELYLRAVLSSKYIPEEVWAVVDRFHLDLQFWRIEVSLDPSADKIPRLLKVCNETRSYNIAMWKGLVCQYPENYKLATALQSMFQTIGRDHSNLRGEISFWTTCIRFKPDMDHFCQKLDDAYGRLRVCSGALTLEEEATEWKSLLWKLNPKHIMEDSILTDYVEDIIEQVANAGAGESAWRDARDFWGQTVRKYSRAPPKYIERLRKCFERAENRVPIFELGTLLRRKIGLYFSMNHSRVHKTAKE